MPNLAVLNDDDCEFPPIEQALESPEGLLALGGDLSVERLIAAYTQGIFPWYGPEDPLLWWSPSPRSVLIPTSIKISKSLAKRLRKKDFSVSMDGDFEKVISACQKIYRPDQNGTWISQEMKQAYLALHQQGYAHSVEVYNKEQILMGGLYGVAIGKIFFGESMFSYESDGSKIALVHLALQLEAWGYLLIDCQMETPHLNSMGAKNISRAEFKQFLEENNSKSKPETWTLNL